MSQRTPSLAGTAVSSGVGKLLSSRSLQLLNKLLTGVQNGRPLDDRQVTNVAKKTGMSQEEVRAWVQVRTYSENDALGAIQEDNHNGPLPLSAGNLQRLPGPIYPPLQYHKPTPPPEAQTSHPDALGAVQEIPQNLYQWDRFEDMPGPLWDLMIAKLYKGTSHPKSKGKRTSPFRPDLSAPRKEQLETWERKVQELAAKAAKKRKFVEAIGSDSRSQRVQKITKSLELPPGWKL